MQLKSILYTCFFASLFLMFGLLVFGVVQGEAAGQYSLSPQNGTFYVGRRFETTIRITTDQATTAADVIITYDSCVLEVEDAYSGVSGVQIFPGTLFPNYPNIANQVTTSGCSGTIKLTGFTADSSGVLQGGGSGDFGRIRYKVRDVALSGTTVAFTATGFGPTFTLDSNISDTNGIDMLSAKTDGNFILRTDNDPVPDNDDRPYFGSFNPLNAAQNIPLNTNIAFQALDNESGVDVNTMQASVSINGTAAALYTNASSEITRTCTTSNLDAVPTCNFIINPAADFPYDSEVCTTLNIRDLARTPIAYADISNSAAPQTWCFRTVFDTVKPYTVNNIPGKNSGGNATNTPFTFDLRDNETGVDIDSVIITLDGVDYTKNGINSFIYTGNPTGYQISINPLPTYSENQQVTVRIRAKDRATQNGIPVPNLLDETYIFTTKDTQTPFVSSTTPAANSGFVDACLPITVVLEDTGTGVDIDTVRVYVSATNQYYTKASFTFTGNSRAYTITIPQPANCWLSNSPIAVGVFAKDVAGNYLDAFIMAIGGSATQNPVIQTITNTIIQTVKETVPNAPTLLQGCDVKAVISGIQSGITAESLLQALAAKCGFSVDTALIEKTKQEAQKSLDIAARAALKSKIETVQGAIPNQGYYWTFEGFDMVLNGKGEPNTELYITIAQSKSGFTTKVDDTGNWRVNIPAVLKGFGDFEVFARGGVDGAPFGTEQKIGTIRILPWWWVAVGAGTITALVFFYSNNRLKQKVKELSQLPR
jgi:hypothetical protein